SLRKGGREMIGQRRKCIVVIKPVPEIELLRPEAQRLPPWKCPGKDDPALPEMRMPDPVAVLRAKRLTGNIYCIHPAVQQTRAHIVLVIAVGSCCINLPVPAQVLPVTYVQVGVPVHEAEP